MARTVYRVPALSAMRREAAGSSLQCSGWLRKTVCAHELLLQNGYDILPTDASAFGFPDQLAGCLGGVPQGSSHKEAILNDNLQLVAEAGKNSLIKAVAAYPSMLFVLCGRCPLPGCLAEYELAPRAHDRA